MAIFGSCRRVSQEFLVTLAGRTSLLHGAGGVILIDVDSLLRRVFSKRKQGAGPVMPRSAGMGYCCAV